MNQMMMKNNLSKVEKSASIEFDVKALTGDDQEGIFEGYGSVFGNIDRDMDIMQKGCFKKSIKDRLPAFLWQHNHNVVLGRFLEVREDEKGLYIKGQFLTNEGTKGREAWLLMKLEALKSFSIGFMTKKCTHDNDKGIRTIHEADLWEVSLVTFPANEEATATDVKSAEQVKSKTDLESVLREAGYSRKQAKDIVHNFLPKSDKNLREAGSVLADINAQLEQNLKKHSKG